MAFLIGHGFLRVVGTHIDRLHFRPGNHRAGRIERQTRDGAAAKLCGDPCEAAENKNKNGHVGQTTRSDAHISPRNNSHYREWY